MNVGRSDYTDEEIDAVIDHFDLGFMRNRLKQSDADLLELMTSFGGTGVVLAMRVKQLRRAILDSIKGIER